MSNPEVGGGTVVVAAVVVALVCVVEGGDLSPILDSAPSISDRVGVPIGELAQDRLAGWLEEWYGERDPSDNRPGRIDARQRPIAEVADPNPPALQILCSC
jgi:hypothetical protein